MNLKGEDHVFQSICICLGLLCFTQGCRKSFDGSAESRQIASAPERIEISLSVSNREWFTIDASRFLVALNKQDKLPGCTTKEDGEITKNDSEGGNDSTSYPVWRHFFLVEFAHTNFYFGYSVVKESESSQWQLRKAWRRYRDRNETEVLPLP
jgi:hypothetical protein